ncbi:MAG TPA: hypothetical protein VFT45_22395 [Longimicrobium sp.]|nr:hypothetical protein [Longimicrobium sp.]
MHRWLYAGRVAVLAMTVACAPVAAQQTTTPAAGQQASAARPPDVASPEALVTALYDVISGPASQARDWDRFRSLFLPNARLTFLLEISPGEKRLFNLTVEEFIQLAGPGYQSGAGFWEREIGHRIDRFGTVAHVFTAYESRLTSPNPNSPVDERGINSVQTIQHEGRWWIANLVFDSETPANPIPPEYLNAQHE